jgi:hypothetical protein
MSDAAAEAGGAPSGFAELALVGHPAASGPVRRPDVNVVTVTDATADRPASDAREQVMGPAGYRFGDYGKLGLPVVDVFSS